MKFLGSLWVSLFLPLCHGGHRWKTGEGQILHSTDGGRNWEKARLSGASWFGFETQDYMINGLWTHTMDEYLRMLKGIGINVIRVPFSAEWIFYHHDLYPYDGLISADPSLKGKTSADVLDTLFEKAAMNGIGIMLDLHRLHKEYISELWYSPTDNEYTASTYYQTWFRMLDHVLKEKNHTNLIAVDILNEPHGQATWGTGDASNDWRMFIQEAVPKIVTRYHNHSFLVFVEGIEWGHTFRYWNDNNAPIVFPPKIMERIVFSPHTYGKSVVQQTPDDYNQLVAGWETDFGFLRRQGYTVAVGEWGGITSLDAGWMNSLVQYLTSANMTDQFFWSLGPNSGDVQGILLDDWTTMDTFKKDVIHKLVPHPTTFTF